jgi:predicted nuclease with TOPRIM domain
MSATLTGERPALAAKRDAALERLAAMRAELTRLSEELQEAHDEFNSYTMRFWRAKEHIDSAWRSVRYAIENVENR